MGGSGFSHLFLTQASLLISRIGIYASVVIELMTQQEVDQQQFSEGAAQLLLATLI